MSIKPLKHVKKVQTNLGKGWIEGAVMDKGKLAYWVVDVCGRMQWLSPEEILTSVDEKKLIS